MGDEDTVLVGESLRFQNAMHLTNFMNYLYRTDKAQKWTCDSTAENEEFHADGTAWRFCADYGERREHKLDAHRAIARSVGAMNVNMIKTGRFENLIMYPPAGMGLADLADEVHVAANEQKRWTLDAVVSHVDQPNGPHLHVLGHLKEGLRRKRGESLTSALFGDL